VNDEDLHSPVNDENALTVPMTPGGPPEWPGATWIASLNLAALPTTGAGAPRRVTLPAPAADGYTRARVLIRDGYRPLRFAEAAVVDGDLTLELPALEQAAPAAPAALPPSSVVLCTRDRPDDLRGALRSLQALDYPDFEIVVVDNAPSTDGTAQVVDEFGDPRIRRVLEQVPGLASARNAGLRAAAHEIVAFTDDDVVADAGWLRGIAAGFARADDVVCVCGTVPSGELRTLSHAYFDWRVSWGENLQSRVYRLAEPPADLPLFPFQVGAYGTGANFALRAEAAAAIGAFDERLGAGTATRGGEDLDMFFRVLAAGHALAAEPSAIIWHRHRSDSDALLSQAKGYGVGLGAWLTKVALTKEHRRLALRVVRRRVGAVGRAGAAYASVAAPPAEVTDGLPRSVGRTEVLSVLGGPRALWRESRRRPRSTWSAAATGTRR